MPDQTTPLPLLQRILNNQRFQMLLLSGVKASGVLAIPFVKKWFPDLSAESLTGSIIMGVPFVVGVTIDWYRNHPDNLIARTIKVINGGKVSAVAVEKLTVAVDNAPPAKS